MRYSGGFHKFLTAPYHVVDRYSKMKTKEDKRRSAFKLPRAAYIIICALPAAATILFYALRGNSAVMERAALRVSAPIRAVLGLFSSVYPFSLMELLCVVAGIWLIIYIINTIIATIRGREKLKTLSKRFLHIAVTALYFWGSFCWLWNSGYYAPGFAEKNGFSGGGVSTESLCAVAEMFAAKANELSTLVRRDDNGHYNEDRREIFDASTSIYQNIAAEFPCLNGRINKPKSMLFSWLMSRTGYTGVYFALTGESNINTRAPLFLIPATIAHELAHQRGVFREDEANFVGILASVASGITVYEYAGYLMGLMHLRSALYSADYQAWVDLSDSLRIEVNIDLQDHYDYWRSQKTVETGVAFFDNVLTTLTGAVSDTVNTVYDGYLKSHNQELGLKSYGACVDLLVEYYSGGK